MQARGHTHTYRTCQHVNVFPYSLNLRAVVEVRRTDSLAHGIPVRLAAGYVGDSLLAHDVQQLMLSISEMKNGDSSSGNSDSNNSGANKSIVDQYDTC